MLRPEEAALMRSGLAELARLRRQGAKAVKHAPLEREVRCRAGPFIRSFCCLGIRLHPGPAPGCSMAPTVFPYPGNARRLLNLFTSLCPSLARPWLGTAQVYVSLEKLNSGCIKTVAVERRRVAPDGREFASTKNIHLVLR